jgi:hypothetical protein
MFTSGSMGGLAIPWWLPMKSDLPFGLFIEWLLSDVPSELTCSVALDMNLPVKS